MKVTLIAHTALSSGLYDALLPVYDAENAGTNFADRLAEFAGRACYQSWDRPNPATATNKGYLQNILFQNHGSVLEHASATFYIEGVSRNLTHELIRHRHLSYSELSQRYVDVSTYDRVLPPAYKVMDWDSPGTSENFADVYEAVVRDLTAAGFSRKEAREAARSELPSSMETKIVVTGNHRAWREVLEKRGSLHADAEIRQLAIGLFRQLVQIAPNTYQDFSEASEEGKLWLKRTPAVRPTSGEPTVAKKDSTESMKELILQAARSCGMTPQDFAGV